MDPESGLRCAVLGSPVAHSLSPALHRAAYAHLGLDWAYDRFEVTAPQLARFLDRLGEEWRGISLTMPLKEAALQVVDQLSDTARRARAVNTIVLDPDRRVGDRQVRRHGDNTDVAGVRDALTERAVREPDDVAVLGGGATARSVLVALAERVDRATAFVRSPDRADDLSRTASEVDLTLAVRPWSERAGALAADLVVAAVPAGAVTDLAPLVVGDAGSARQPRVLLDVAYDPWPTPLAAAWSRAGGPVVSGLDLLVHQAVHQVRLMTGRAVPVEVLRAAGLAALASPR